LAQNKCFFCFLPDFNQLASDPYERICTRSPTWIDIFQLVCPGRGYSYFYPNPTPGYSYIVLDPAFGKMQLSIYDTNGRMILMDRFAGKKRINGIRPGFYFLRLTGPNGILVRTVLVK